MWPEFSGPGVLGANQTPSGSSGWDFGINLINAAARSYQSYVASQALNPYGSPYAQGAGSGCPPGFYLPAPGSPCTPIPGAVTAQTNLLPLILIAGAVILAVVLLKK